MRLRSMRVDREVRIHMQLKHPHVVRMHSWWEDDERVYMVLDLQPGDLFRTLITRGQLTEEGTVLDVLVPLLDALIYMHKRVSQLGGKVQDHRLGLIDYH